jgi:integrase/recombinase XerD
VNASPSWLAMRLSVVRGFTSWLQAGDQATEVPPLRWLPPRHRRNTYLYSDTDIAALLAVARRARWPLSAATYEALIGLLVVSGMRVGEAIRLDRADVSFTDGLLTVRESKFGKSRQIPIHPTTVTALRHSIWTAALRCPRPRVSPACSSTPPGTGSPTRACNKCSMSWSGGPASLPVPRIAGPPSTGCVTASR